MSNTAVDELPAGILEKLNDPQVAVTLRRYATPMEQFGVHALTPRTHPRFSFHLNTVGLFREPHYTLIREHLAAQGYVPFPLPELLPLDGGGTELYEYIGHQVIPMEWKPQFWAADEDVVGLITVWVKV